MGDGDVDVRIYKVTIIWILLPLPCIQVEDHDVGLFIYNFQKDCVFCALEDSHRRRVFIDNENTVGRIVKNFNNDVFFI